LKASITVKNVPAISESRLNDVFKALFKANLKTEETREIKGYFADYQTKSS